MVLLEELFRAALTFTHTHTERMGSSVFHVSMVIQRCSKTFPLVCCSLNVKTARSFTHTHIVQEEMCEVCSGCQEFLSQSTSHAHIHIIFQYFLCLTAVVATLTAVWHFVKDIIKNNPLQYNFVTLFRLIKAQVYFSKGQYFHRRLVFTSCLTACAEVVPLRINLTLADRILYF